jgi:hypothetical protein
MAMICRILMSAGAAAARMVSRVETHAAEQLVSNT